MRAAWVSGGGVGNAGGCANAIGASRKTSADRMCLSYGNVAVRGENPLKMSGQFSMESTTYKENCSAVSGFAVGHNLLFERQPGVFQGSPAAVQRDRIRIAHLLQVIRDQGRPEASAAIQHQLGRLIRDLCLDVAL